MKNTMENNILIAKFLGFDILENGYFNYEGELTRDLPNFDIDWNWIMKVVFKIEELNYEVKIKGISCSVNRVLEKETLISYVLGNKGNKIELVYTVVVGFIKWYNQQKN